MEGFLLVDLYQFKKNTLSLINDASCLNVLQCTKWLLAGFRLTEDDICFVSGLKNQNNKTFID